MDKISIIVPIYNAKDYLSNCIESLINQTYNNIEVILVDDGSIDGSGNLCDLYALNDKRIRVIHKNNEGPVIARKVGFGEAKGKYIAFADADDWMELDMIETLYEALISNSVDVSMCGRYEHTGNTIREVYHGIDEGKYGKKDLVNSIYPNMIVNGAFFEWGIFPGYWDKLFKREALEGYLLGVDERIFMGEDAACVYPCLLNVNSIYILKKCLYHYRQTVNSMVKQKKDVEGERKRFNILYNSVLESFDKYKNVYDMRNQWKEYLLFLMTPRADLLYKDIEELEYLFPFPNVKRGNSIILYGMGTYGQLLCKFIKKSGICNIVACADRNYIELNKQGLDVISPDEIVNKTYDYIVVANSFAKVRNAIYKDLTSKYGTEKVQVMDEELIKSDESLRAFGLID